MIEFYNLTKTNRSHYSILFDNFWTIYNAISFNDLTSQKLLIELGIIIIGIICIRCYKIKISMQHQFIR